MLERRIRLKPHRVGLAHGASKTYARTFEKLRISTRGLDDVIHGAIKIESWRHYRLNSGLVCFKPGLNDIWIACDRRQVLTCYFCRGGQSVASLCLFAHCSYSEIENLRLL